MQDRLPPELPGRGEGLPPLCPPAQVPRTERSHLTQSPHPPQRPRGEGSAQPCSWVCHQPRPLSQGVTAVSLVRKTLRCDRSMSVPEGALDDWCPPLICSRRWDTSRRPLSGVLGWGDFALIRLQLTSLTWHPHQGCSHTVEIRLGAHFQIHIPD